MLGEFAQLRHGGGMAVDQGTRAAVGLDQAAQHHGTRIAGKIALGQPGTKRRGERELGDDVGAGRALTHHAGIAAAAQRELQRVDEDGLAGAGLAGEHGEARPELEFERVDDDEVPQAQGKQHGRTTRPQAAGRDRTGSSCQLSLPRRVAKWL